MNIILIILGFASLAHLAADFLNQFDELPMKPFKCNLCLGFWLALFPCMYLYSIEGILLAAISGVVSEIIYRTINRI